MTDYPQTNGYYAPGNIVHANLLGNPRQGLRDDKSKLGLHLLPVRALEEVARVFDYGKNKYTSETYDATDNWRKGLSWRSTTGSLLRHAFSFLRGEDRDPESGLYHAAHIAANALFLIQFLIEGGGTDDRYKETSEKDKQDRPNVQHIF